MNKFIPIAYHRSYKLDVPKEHRFPMEKYELLPKELVNQKISNKSDFFSPSSPEWSTIIEVHEESYVLKLKNLKLTNSEIRKIGFPLSKELINREFIITGGTIMGAEKAIRTKISMNIAGGTHHSFSNRGEGFCLLNDQAIAANYLLKNHDIEKIMIIDLDVHQGNGTASIFKNDMNVFTLSFHGKKNYPFKKEKSDLDIEFDDGTEDVEYLTKLEDVIPNIIKILNPDFIFYLSGVDILKTDKLGRLSLSIEGCKKRDSIILNLCKTFNIPLQISMGGGYSKNIEDIINAHCNTFRLAKEIYF